MIYPISRTSAQPPGTVLKRLGQMSGSNLLLISQVGDGAGQLEDSVKGSGGKLELTHRLA